ncbi:MAG: ABC transporter permease [Actinomycetes bacterium]|jgi:spermidine/putrescine transport system permease protein
MAVAARALSAATPNLKKKSLVPYLLLAPGLLWLALFFLAPIITLVGTATKTPGVGIGEFIQTYRWANYWDSIFAARVQFGRSFLYALIATLLALAIAYPLAYGIAFKSGKYKNILLVLVVAPFFCSFILRTIAWKQILGQNGPVYRFLADVHLIGSTTHLTASAPAVIIGLAYNFLPFMTLPLYGSLERIDPRVLEASGDLYANPFTTFRRVTVPLSMPGVVAGTLLTFIPAAGDYVNAEILGNPRTKMIGNVINSKFLNEQDYPTAAALSFILMIVISIFVMIYIRKAGTEELV